MGIYRRGNIFWVSKTINGILYRKSTETESKMRARAIYEDWTAGLKESVRTGRPVVTAVRTEAIPAMTFNELADKYLEFTSGRLKSHYNVKCFIKTLNDRFNGKLLKDFTIFDLESLQNDIIAKFSVAYANRLVVLVKTMLNKAFDWELVDEDVIKRLKKCKLLKGEIKRLRYLSEEEAERLVSNCDGYLKPIVITALNSGMRKSEILKLTWDRVDLKNRIILLDKTKNGERREIPINDTLYQAFEGLTRHLKTDCVFYNPETLKPYYGLNKAFDRALRKAHITDFRIHDLRHTFASWLVMKGIDLTSVKELLGHKDIKMTLRYAHLAPSHIKKAVGILDKKMSSADLKIHNSFTMEEEGKASNL